MRAFLVLCSLLVLATFAEAQAVRRCGTPTYSTYQPTYYQQSYVTPSYYPPTYIQQVAVPVYLPPDYYFSLAGRYERDAERKAFLWDLQQSGMLKTGSSQPQEQPQPGKAKVQYSQEQPVALSTGIPDGLQEIVNGKCLKCHKGATAKKGIDLSNLATVSQKVRDKCYRQVTTDRMPYKEAPLTEAEMPKFLQWCEMSDQ